MLHGVFEDVQKVLTEGERYLDIITSAIEDPALPQVASLVRQIKALEPPKATTPGGAPKPAIGLGLHRTVRPLEFYIYTRKHSWVLPTILASAILIPVGLGFGLGRLTKSCSR